MVVALAVVVITAEDGAADVAVEEHGSSSGLLKPRSTLHPSTSLVGWCHLAWG